MISLNDVLLAMSNIPVDDPIAEIWGRQMQDGYKIIEYTGSLPITITANGDALIDYRIYGASGGVGEQTENLIDASKPGVQQRVEVEPGENYCLSKYRQLGSAGRPQYAIYDENDKRIKSDYIAMWVSVSFTIPANGKYALIIFGTNYAGLVSFAKGTAPNTGTPYPKTYIPYGYKLPTVTKKNLFDPNGTYEVNKFKNDVGNIASYNNAGYYTQYMPINSEEPISVKNARGNYDLAIRLYYYDSQKNWIIRSGGNGYLTDFTETPPAGAAFIQLQLGVPYTANADKIIISQGGTTTPVYIGENQLGSVEGVSDYVDKSSGKIVRMIGEYTFTGDENFNKYGNSDVFYTSKTIDPVGITTVNTITMRCNHPAFTAIENKDTRYWLNPKADDICCFLPGGMSQVFLRSTANFTTVEECNAYFKAQYDNGTPVKISYWLKTPIEEDPPVPLPEIPTINGETIIDYDGTPKPSQMYVKYKGKG